MLVEVRCVGAIVRKPHGPDGADVRNVQAVPAEHRREGREALGIVVVPRRQVLLDSRVGGLEGILQGFAEGLRVQRRARDVRGHHIAGVPCGLGGGLAGTAVGGAHHNQNVVLVQVSLLRGASGRDAWDGRRQRQKAWTRWVKRVRAGNASLKGLFSFWQQHNGPMVLAAMRPRNEINEEGP